MEIYSLRTAEQYIEDIKRYLISRNSKFNNFNVGSRLLTMIEAVAISAGIDSAEFFNGLKRAIPVAIYSAFDFTLKSGTASVGNIEFYNNDPVLTNKPIPVGTRIQVQGLVFETISPATILAGNTSSGNVPARATTAGFNTNIDALAIDTKNGDGTMLNAPDGVEFAKNISPFAAGTDGETEEDRIIRFQAFINGLSRANLKGVITGLNSISGLISYSLVPNFPTAGTVTVYAEDGPGILTPGKKAEIEKTLLGDINDIENYPGYVALGITVNVLPPTSVPVTLEFEIVVKDTSPLALNNALVPPFLAALKSEIEKYVNTHKIGEDVVISELVTLIQNYDTEVFDILLVVPALITSNFVAAPAEALRTGAGSGGTVTLTLSSTSVY